MDIVNTIIQFLPFIAVVILYSFIVGIIGRTVYNWLKNYQESAETETKFQKFYKLTFELLKLRTNDEAMIPHISRIFIQSSGISENDPNFFYSLIDHLQKLEMKILGKEYALGISDRTDEDILFYVDIIHEIITTIEHDHPYFGLNEDELSFFMDFKRETETRNVENCLLKLIELSKRIKAKNIDIALLNEKAAKADIYGIISVVLTVLSIIITVLAAWATVTPK
jgi:hypothetical protein